MTEERRQVPRYDLLLPVRVGSIHGTTRNLSLEGVLFVTPRMFAEGDRVDVTIFVSADPRRPVLRLEGNGTVVRSHRATGLTWETAVSLDGLRVLSDALSQELNVSYGSVVH